MAQDKIRAFIAIGLPEDIKKRIAVAQSGLESSWITKVKKDQLHITLLFFAGISTENANRIKAEMDSIRDKPFDITVKGTGAFTPKNPRVLFIDIDAGAAKIAAIYSRLRATAQDMGVEVEDREFTPHITVARVKGGERMAMLEAENFLEDNSGKEFGTFQCKEIKFIKSTLTENGPVYETIYTKEFA